MLFMKTKLLRIVGCFHNRKKGISLVAIIKYKVDKVVLNLTEQVTTIGEHLNSRTGLRSAVRNVSDCKYLSDRRSRGHNFDPSPVPCFRGD